MQSDYAVLPLSDSIVIDALPLRLLVQDVGALAAEADADTALEEIVGLLSAAESAWSCAEFGRLRKAAADLCPRSQQLGMQTLVNVSTAVVSLSDGRDPTALAAVVARLQRVGAASLRSLVGLAHENA